MRLGFPWTRAGLKRDGFVLLRGALDRQMLAEALRRAEALRQAGVRFRSDQVVDDVDMLAPRAVRELAEAYLGHPPERHEVSNVRFQKAGGVEPLPYHQDEALLGAPLVNVWIPLTPAGKDAPGLEVIRRSHHAVWPTVGDPQAARTVDRAYLSPATVIAKFGASARFAPIMQPGDVLVFTGKTVHRTHSVPTMTRERASIEHRLA